MSANYNVIPIKVKTYFAAKDNNDKHGYWLLKSTLFCEVPRPLNVFKLI